MIGRTLSDAKGKMQIRIEASDFPGISCGPSPDSPEGYRNIHVGVQRRQRRDELLGLVSGYAFGGFIHILNSDVSTVFANPSTVQIVLRGSGATTNVRFANGGLVATGPASIVEAARRESGAVVKINNTELRPATTSGTPSCFSVFQQNCTAASCL